MFATQANPRGAERAAWVWLANFGIFGPNFPFPKNPKGLNSYIRLKLVTIITK